MREHCIEDGRSADKEDDPEDDVRRPARRDIQQRQEHKEVQQGRAEVLLDDHDRQGDPHIASIGSR